MLHMYVCLCDIYVVYVLSNVKENEIFMQEIDLHNNNQLLRAKVNC